ncbi:MAG: 16S rRNA (adenine(1518)-N(6)/adenine(1519)-N(6))-dimethyltransferase RsmA [Betaproteobacteria bacterium]|nr:16S rRNA (adenine(1518)-N(6)/adenine(1519)-N(6))-dimethyltransferase RsmA [Betaproteobacteria bacterium]
MHVARKRFGQHFLVDRAIIRRIVDAIAPAVTDHVVEIGPGLGALTTPLLERLDHLDVLEIDRDIAASLRREHPPERLTVHEGDALAFDLASLGHDLRIVGNLPYNISTPILFHIARHLPVIRDCHFMLQREVVDRMVAPPGNKAFGRLSVMLQYRFEMEKLLDVAAGAFRPPPQVRSAVVRMTPLRSDERVRAQDERTFNELVTQAFSFRRKTLRNAMQGLLDESGIEAAGLDPGARPETIDVAGFVRAANEAVRRRGAG